MKNFPSGKPLSSQDSRHCGHTEGTAAEAGEAVGADTGLTRQRWWEQEAGGHVGAELQELQSCTERDLAGETQS